MEMRECKEIWVRELQILTYTTTFSISESDILCWFPPVKIVVRQKISFQTKYRLTYLNIMIIVSVFSTYAQYNFSYNSEICNQVFIFYCFLDHYTWNFKDYHPFLAKSIWISSALTPPYRTNLIFSHEFPASVWVFYPLHCPGIDKYNWRKIQYRSKAMSLNFISSDLFLYMYRS